MSRFVLFLLLAFSLVFVAIGIAMLVSAAWQGWTVVVFFGVCAAVAAAQLWPGLLAARGPEITDLIGRFPQAVELHASRKRLVFLLVTSAGFAAVLGWLLLRERPGILGQFALWPALILLAAGVPVSLFLLIKGSFIRLDRDGLTLKHLWRSRFMPWDDVDGFSVARIPPAGMEMVVFDYTPTSGRAAAGLNRRLVGRNSALPDSYGLSPGDLAMLLAGWRQRALAATGKEA